MRRATYGSSVGRATTGLEPRAISTTCGSTLRTWPGIRANGRGWAAATQFLPALPLALKLVNLESTAHWALQLPRTAREGGSARGAGSMHRATSGSSAGRGTTRPEPRDISTMCGDTSRKGVESMRGGRNCDAHIRTCALRIVRLVNFSKRALRTSNRGVR